MPSYWTPHIYIYKGGAKKSIHILRDVIYVLLTRSVSTLMVATLSTSCNCRSQTWLAFILITITILIQYFPFLKCVYFCLAPSVYMYVCVCVYIYQIGATDTRGEVSATAVLSKPFSHQRLQTFAVFSLSLSFSLC